MGKTALAPELLEILVCPACHGELDLVQNDLQDQGLHCRACKLRYPVRDGIPVMLVSEAEQE